MLASAPPNVRQNYEYCHACGEQVLTYPAKGTIGIEMRCSSCGFALGRRQQGASRGAGCVLLADDEKLTRWILEDILREQVLAEAVVACEGGIELLTRFTEQLRASREISLVILDILMRDLDGLAAAKAVRAVERGFGRASPVPILFLSALRPDVALRSFVAKAQPALFLNKAVDATPDRLAVRLRKLFDYLARAREGPGHHHLVARRPA